MIWSSMQAIKASSMCTTSAIPRISTRDRFLPIQSIASTLSKVLPTSIVWPSSQDMRSRSLCTSSIWQDTSPWSRRVLLLFVSHTNIDVRIDSLFGRILLISMCLFQQHCPTKPRWVMLQRNQNPQRVVLHLPVWMVVELLSKRIPYPYQYWIRTA